MGPGTTPILQRIRLTAQTAANFFSLPAGAILKDIAIANTTANAITGGLKFGTTAGGTDIVAAQAVGANGLVVVPDASFVSRYFSLTAAQKIYFDAVTAWNSASVQIDVYYYL